MMGPVLSLADFGSTEGACMRARLCRWPFVNPRRPAVPRGHRSDLQPTSLPKMWRLQLDGHRSRRDLLGSAVSWALDMTMTTETH